MVLRRAMRKAAQLSDPAAKNQILSLVGIQTDTKISPAGAKGKDSQ
jgi:hypothetical protein